MATNRSQHPPDPRVAKRLKAILNYHSVTAAQLSARTGITPASISQWLGSKTRMSEKSARRVASALAEDVDFVLCRVESGSTGLGSALGWVEEVLGAQRLKAMSQLDSSELVETIDKLIELSESKISR